MNTIFYLSAVYIPTLDVNTFHVISGLDLICKKLIELVTNENSCYNKTLGNLCM